MVPRSSGRWSKPTPAFVNDNALASEYFNALMAWLVATDQVNADKANATTPGAYWTNALVL